MHLMIKINEHERERHNTKVVYTLIQSSKYIILWFIIVH